MIISTEKEAKKVIWYQEKNNYLIRSILCQIQNTWEDMMISSEEKSKESYVIPGKESLFNQVNSLSNSKHLGRCDDF